MWCTISQACMDVDRGVVEAAVEARVLVVADQCPGPGAEAGAQAKGKAVAGLLGPLVR